MRTQEVCQLLTEIHRSIDRVAEELSQDRPQLAAALQSESHRLPLPEELGCADQIATRPTAAGACTTLPPLLYAALDEGLLDATRFDALMVRRGRAARALKLRKAG